MSERRASAFLRRISASDVAVRRTGAIDPGALTAAASIVADVRDAGEAAIRRHAERFDEIAPGDPIRIDRDRLAVALDEIGTADRDALERAADRVRSFSIRQMAQFVDFDMDIPGGVAGQRVIAVDSAGCYAPGGRHPLPSSVIMTAATARAAGCRRVVVASPKPAPATLAAAYISGADELLPIGGAHAIAALAYGFEGFEPCDTVAGPGNKYVTAAKHIVSSVVGIDMLAGPSELLVLADDAADASLVAADLLAQAEHDDDAIPVLVTTSRDLADAVVAELARQIDSLPTAAAARNALRNGFIAVAGSIDDAIAASDRFGPEHLAIHARNPAEIEARLRHAGAVFVGGASAEVFGDYGAGPNHTLPTGGTARHAAGLSVLHFLRLRTRLHLNTGGDSHALRQDSARLARLEGLEAHARSALARPPAQGG